MGLICGFFSTFERLAGAVFLWPLNALCRWVLSVFLNQGLFGRLESMCLGRSPLQWILNTSTLAWNSAFSLGFLLDQKQALPSKWANAVWTTATIAPSSCDYGQWTALANLLALEFSRQEAESVSMVRLAKTGPFSPANPNKRLRYPSHLTCTQSPAQAQLGVGVGELWHFLSL